MFILIPPEHARVPKRHQHNPPRKHGTYQNASKRQLRGVQFDREQSLIASASNHGASSSANGDEKR